MIRSRARFASISFFAARLEEFNKPFLYYEIIEGGHNTGANLKAPAQTEAVDYIYLTRKLMD
jgi:prolyl oligopeptidase